MSNEQLWAPWRMQYIVSDKNESSTRGAADLLPDAVVDCFLCQAATPGEDRQRYVVARGEHTVTLLNRYPYNNGHLLVAPKRHVARLDELDEEAELEIFRTVSRMVGLLDRAMQPQGFNVGLNLGQAAGAGHPGHLHWHIVPRWTGDTNFMPTLAGVNTIPQSLEALWELLTKAIGQTPRFEP